MKFETLKQNRRKKIVIGLVVFIAVISTLSLMGTRAKYRTTQSIKIVEGTIRNYSPADFNILAIKVQNDSGEYDSSNTIPESGYKLNETESYCTIPDGSGNNEKDSSITINYHDGVVGFDNMTKKGTKCYLYFDVVASGTILANKTISTRTDFSTVLTTDTTGTIYSAEDDDGTSYYFAGAPTDNWVKFAGFYWRIIRINGDGSVRLIYQGTSANTTGTGTQIGTSPFNSEKTDYMYVGYMYTSGAVHGTGTASTIKGILDSWYDSNLESYASYIDTNAGFCGDRTPYTSNDGTTIGVGTGTTTTHYGTYIRLYNSESASNATPSFKCPDSSTDLYTISSSNKGNKALNKPIGLITADEVAYAGGVVSVTNSSYYLHTNQHYWTMSPSYYNIFDGAYEFIVAMGGWLGRNQGGGVIWDESGVRPVINLRADTAFADGGKGTSSNPYVVS